MADDEVIAGSTHLAVRVERHRDGRIGIELGVVIGVAQGIDRVLVQWSAVDRCLDVEDEGVVRIVRIDDATAQGRGQLDGRRELDGRGELDDQDLCRSRDPGSTDDVPVRGPECLGERRRVEIEDAARSGQVGILIGFVHADVQVCLLYTSDAADE